MPRSNHGQGRTDFAVIDLIEKKEASPAPRLERLHAQA